MYDHGRVSAADPTPPTAGAAAATSGNVEPAEAAPVRGRRPNLLRDMALSLGVLIVPLMLLMAFCRPSASDIATVDPSRVFQAAKAEAAFPVRIPSTLPDSWRATNAGLVRGDGGTLTVRVSYLTAGDRFVQLVQSDVASDALIPAELGAGKIQGMTQVGGVTWQRYDGRRAGETALVLLSPKSTVLLSGDASLGEITTLASSLR